MSTDLRAALQAKALRFADELYETAMKHFSSELARVFSTSAPSPAKTAETSGRAKFGAAEIDSALTATLDLLATRPKGLRLEGLRDELKLSGAVLKRAIEKGRKDGRIHKAGDRRASTYTLPVAPSPGQAAGRVVKRKKP